MATEQQQGDQQQLERGTANRDAGGDRKAGLEAGGPDAAAAEEEEEQQGAAEDGAEQEGEEGEEEQQHEAADDSYVAARLRAASLEDGPTAEEVSAMGGRLTYTFAILHCLSLVAHSAGALLLWACNG